MRVQELETTKSLLITQQQINDDMKLLKEYDNKKSIKKNLRNNLF